MRCLKNNPVKKISRSALALWTPSARCFRNLLGDCKCSSKCCRCFGIFCKIFVVALCYSILLILAFILFWGVVLAVLITIFVFPFAIAAGLIIFRNLPFCRLFLFAWHVIRQLLTGDPSTRISCLRCTYKDFIDKCEQCFKKCKQCLECEKCDNESQAAAGNGNTHKKMVQQEVMEIHNKEMVQQEVVKQHLRRIVMLCQFFFIFVHLFWLSFWL